MLQAKTYQVLLVCMGVYIFFGVTGCDFSSEKDKEEETEKEENIVFTDTITVTASAYNSVKLQGEGNGNLTAWGDTLAPGMKSIAVSRDLVRKGLTHGTPVAIEGFEGIFIVNDKMHQRWRNKIDIYMGVDIKRAINWGRRKVKISFPGQEEVEIKKQ